MVMWPPKPPLFMSLLEQGFRMEETFACDSSSMKNRWEASFLARELETSEMGHDFKLAPKPNTFRVKPSQGLPGGEGSVRGFL